MSTKITLGSNAPAEDHSTSNTIPNGSAGVSVRTKGGSLSLNFGGDEGLVNNNHVQETTGNEERVAASPNSIMATARSKTGVPVAAHDVKPDSLVTYQGLQMSVQQAVDAGLVTLHDGRYVNLV